MTDFWPLVNWKGSDGAGNVNPPDSLNEGYEGGTTAHWRMKDWTGVGGPWYWWIPKQQPRDFSFYSSGVPPFRAFGWGPPIMSTDFLGDTYLSEWDHLALQFWDVPAQTPFWVQDGLSDFELLPYFPTLFIIPENYIEHGSQLYGAPIAEVGANSLEDAITNYAPDIQDFFSQRVPNFGFDNARGVWGLLGPGGDDNGVFGSPMTQPPQAPNPALAMFGTTYTPSIWQLLNLAQPPLKDPTKSWNPLNNTYSNPSAALAKKAATTFAEYWNGASASQIAAADAFAASDGAPGPPAPAEWEFGGNAAPFQAVDISHAFAFNAGMPIGYYLGFPAIELPFATAMTIAVGQLNQNKWDTRTFPPTQRNP